MQKRTQFTDQPSENDIEDVSPEARLHASAPPSKSPGGIFSILTLDHFKKEQVLRAPPNTLTRSDDRGLFVKLIRILRFFSNRAAGIKVSIFDHGVGLMEKFSRSHKHESSIRAWNEWLDYYRGLYREKSPDPFYFKRLLVRNGLPDYPNPYPPNSGEYYDFHPDGLIFIEFETLLSALLSMPDDEKEKSNHGVVPEWMTVEESNAERDGGQLEAARENHKKALATWAFILLHSQNIGRIRDVVHPENLEFITVYLLRNLNGVVWGLDMRLVAKHACRLKIIDNSWIQMLQQSTQLDISNSGKLGISGIAPPAIPLDDWRKNRKEE